MFAQMCEAVAAAHAQGVYHRDIKPENFIVTDGFVERPDGSRERKVFVKLTDFGLGTTDRDSGDMDCGSAPYMSYGGSNENFTTSYHKDLIFFFFFFFQNAVTTSLPAIAQMLRTFGPLESYSSTCEHHAMRLI
jgi:serine/threonine protein kinase